MTAVTSNPVESGTLETIPADTPLAPPVTFKLGENLYVALTEANNDSFPDMGLERDGTFLKAVFPASSKGWSQQGTIVTPWRVAIIAEGLNALVNSDIVTNLCPPPSAELANADWIKPGRVPLAVVGHRRPQARTTRRNGLMRQRNSVSSIT